MILDNNLATENMSVEERLKAIEPLKSSYLRTAPKIHQAKVVLLIITILNFLGSIVSANSIPELVIGLLVSTVLIFLVINVQKNPTLSIGIAVAIFLISALVAFIGIMKLAEDLTYYRTELILILVFPFIKAAIILPFLFRALGVSNEYMETVSKLKELGVQIERRKLINTGATDTASMQRDLEYLKNKVYKSPVLQQLVSKFHGSLSIEELQKMITSQSEFTQSEIDAAKFVLNSKQEYQIKIEKQAKEEELGNANQRKPLNPEEIQMQADILHLFQKERKNKADILDAIADKYNKPTDEIEPFVSDVLKNAVFAQNFPNHNK